MYFKSEKLYHVLCYIAQVVLPAFATFYFTVGQIWHFPYVDEVSRTIVAFDTFLGVILHISSVNYKDNLEGNEK